MILELSLQPGSGQKGPVSLWFMEFMKNGGTNQEPVVLARDLVLQAQRVLPCYRKPLLVCKHVSFADLLYVSYMVYYTIIV